MANYYLVFAGIDGDFTDLALRDKRIILGWGKLGDLRKYPTKEDIQIALSKVYPESEKIPGIAGQRNNAKSIDYFRSIEPGDFIFLRHGRTQIDAWGIAKSTCYFRGDSLVDTILSRYRDYNYGVDVAWKGISPVDWTYKTQFSRVSVLKKTEASDPDYVVALKKVMES